MKREKQRTFTISEISAFPRRKKLFDFSSFVASQSPDYRGVKLMITTSTGSEIRVAAAQQ